MNPDPQKIPTKKAEHIAVEAVRGQSSACDAAERTCGSVIVNADDWGRDRLTTDRSLDCVRRGAVSSVSSMVFMEDSERAADLAREHDVDAGLHLNFTLAFPAKQCPARLREHQERLTRFLIWHRLAPALYHPGLAASFEYVVEMQLEEYQRLYGAPPRRIDGHHHMHLCTNLAVQKLIPAGVIVRRNLSFGRGEKGYFNRLHRRLQDRLLARRYRIADFFFDLRPLEPRERLAGILGLANRFDVEIETHPVRDDEYSFLVNGWLMQCADNLIVSRGYIVHSGKSDSSVDVVPFPEQAWRSMK